MKINGSLFWALQAGGLGFNRHLVLTANLTATPTDDGGSARTTANDGRGAHLVHGLTRTVTGRAPRTSNQRVVGSIPSGDAKASSASPRHS